MFVIFKNLQNGNTLIVIPRAWLYKLWSLFSVFSDTMDPSALMPEEELPLTPNNYIEKGIRFLFFTIVSECENIFKKLYVTRVREKTM